MELWVVELLLSGLEEEQAQVGMACACAVVEREIQLRRVVEGEYRLRVAQEIRERIAREMKPFWAVRAGIAVRLHELPLR